MLEEDRASCLVMVRHTAVAERYKGVCYGASDIELSPGGECHARECAAALAELKPTHLFHSGLKRARIMAEHLAVLSGVEPVEDPRLAEMNFGSWELRSWDEIFAEVGHDMARLISEPDTFAPPGGETAHAVRDRVAAWRSALPVIGRIVAISHGGPIGAMRGADAGLPASGWPALVPAHGQQVVFQIQRGHI